MDVPALLREARARSDLNQRALAHRSGVSRSSISAYESGARSPTAVQLDCVLRACGLQVHAVLEPRSAALDKLVEAALGREPTIALDRLQALAVSLDGAGVQWAVDGATALALQGLAVDGPPTVALVDVAVARSWLPRNGVCGWDRDGFPMALAGDEPREFLDEVLTRPVLGFRLGELCLRLVDELPRPLQVMAGDRPLPVLTLLEVASAQHRWRALIQAVQSRRGSA